MQCSFGQVSQLLLTQSPEEMSGSLPDDPESIETQTLLRGSLLKCQLAVKHALYLNAQPFDVVDICVWN